MQDPPCLPLERQLVSILAANREDAHATQHQRATDLMSAARIIVDGFGLQKWDNLGQKHVQHLVAAWKAGDTGRRTIEHKLSHFRWLLAKVGKQNLLPRSNGDLDIGPGPRHTRAGRVVSDERLDQILAALPEPRIQAMILLARHLGLRFEEASLLRPHLDVQGNVVWIKRGAKGGRSRYVRIQNAAQHEAIEAAKRLTSGDRGLIPVEFATYEQWRQHVYNRLRSVGVGKATDTTFHDLRRSFAVARLRELIVDRGYPRERAVIVVARELGHGRTDVLASYVDACIPIADETRPAA